MSWLEDLEREPYRFDFYTTLRRFEREQSDKPRIGNSATINDDIVKLGQNPYLEFPASNLESFKRREDGRFEVLVRFLGLMGPQGALPLTVTAEAHEWFLARDDAFARFLDLFNNRFLQLFYRAWADARPIAQHERPLEDRFAVYIGSMIGLGTRIYRDLDTIVDAQKLAFAGLMSPAAKSASRLEALILGTTGLTAEVYEFVGTRLIVAPEDRTRIGQANATLGAELMAGAGVYSVNDKIRIRVRAASMEEYTRTLPRGELAEPLVDMVYFYTGETIEWDVEVSIPSRELRPAQLGTFGALGWTTWLNPPIDPEDTSERCDARFNLAERVRAQRKKIPLEKAN
jgi:type VI secretion system protein ImpH